MANRHSDLIAEALLAAQEAGGRAFKRDSGLVYDRLGNRRSSMQGPCDVYGIIPPIGRHVEIEAKVGDDPWRPAQRAWAATMCGLRAQVLLVRRHHRAVGDELEVCADFGVTHLLIAPGEDARARIRAALAGRFGP